MSQAAAVVRAGKLEANGKKGLRSASLLARAADRIGPMAAWVSS